MSIKSETKSTIGLVISAILCTMAISTLLVKCGSTEEKGKIVYDKYEQLSETSINTNNKVTWIQTTLVDHIDKDNEREQRHIEDTKDLKQTMIDQNKLIIKALEEK